MAKYISYFNTTSEYSAAASSGKIAVPNVAYIKDQDKIVMEKTSFTFIIPVMPWDD